VGERLALLTEELRGLINTTTLSYVAIKEGGVGLHGATSAVLETSLVGLNDLVEHALRDVRLALGAPSKSSQVAVGRFMAEATVAASMEARSRGCELTVASVEPGLVMDVDVQMLHSALFDLVQSALVSSRPKGQVWLKARAAADRILIEVEDRCGGLADTGSSNGWDREAGVSRRAIEAMGGTLSFHDMPGLGCVSTIDLPRARAG
jgi:signal transduction histidine kinase